MSNLPASVALRHYESDQAKAYARDDYAVANRDRFMTEAIDEEIREDFAADLRTAAEHLADKGKSAVQPFIEAYVTLDDCELGRLVRTIMSPVIVECSVSRAERMAAEEFDATL